MSLLLLGTYKSYDPQVKCILLREISLTDSFNWCNGNLSANNLSADSSSADNSPNTNLSADNLSADNLSADNLSADNLPPTATRPLGQLAPWGNSPLGVGTPRLG
jgi:hypothetical protein